MKMRHEDEMVRTEREHEEKVLFLLGQLSGTPATNTNVQVREKEEQNNGNFNLASHGKCRKYAFPSKRLRINRSHWYLCTILPFSIIAGDLVGHSI